MGMRSTWRGAVQFGMVTIPVRLYTATDSKDVSFNLLHAKDNARIKLQRFCPETEEVIEWGDVVRGYEYAPDTYVVMTAEDFAAVAPKLVRTTEIRQFVPAGSIPSLAYDKAYFIEPEVLGKKPFGLLWLAMTAKNVVAIATVVLRSKEQLAVIQPTAEHGFVLQTLFYADEIKDSGELDLDLDAAMGAVSEVETQMAGLLVDSLTRPFDAAEYTDSYRVALLQYIDQKAQGAVVAPTPSVPQSDIGNLMEQLKASLQGKPAPAPETPKRAKTQSESTVTKVKGKTKPKVGA